MKHAPLLCLLLSAGLLGACREDERALPDAVPTTEEAVGFFCQMSVLAHAGPKAQIHLEGEDEPLFFVQVRDGLTYLRSPEREARILVSYVSDMGAADSWDDPGAGNWIRADQAIYVIDAGVAGGMGAPEIVPFATADGADAFIARYGGRAVPLDGVPDASIHAPVDPDIRLEVPQ